MSLTLKRRVTVLATVISVMLVAGVVFAAWTANGAGSGSASAGQMTADQTVEATGNVTGLYPNAEDDIVFTIENPNPFKVQVSDLAVEDITVTNSSDEGDACTAADIDITDQQGDLGSPLAANGALDDSGTFDLPVRLVADAANGCQGALFSVAVSYRLTSAESEAAE